MDAPRDEPGDEALPQDAGVITLAWLSQERKRLERRLRLVRTAERALLHAVATEDAALSTGAIDSGPAGE